MSNRPTAADKRRTAKVYALGCIACLIDGNPGTPCSEHHVKELGGYRDHSRTFGLCPAHHQQQFKKNGMPNRHGDRKGFEAVYGTDMELLEETNRRIEQCQ